MYNSFELVPNCVSDAHSQRDKLLVAHAPLPLLEESTSLKSLHEFTLVNHPLLIFHKLLDGLGP